MANFRVATLATPALSTNTKSFSEVVANAVEWLGQPWTIAKPTEADFILMLVNSTKNLKTLQALHGYYPADKLIVANSVGVDLPQVRWHLPFPKLNAYPSVLSIVNLFSRIQETLKNSPLPDANSRFEPNLFLSGIIEQCNNDGIARLCGHPNCPPIIIAPKERSFYLADSIESIIPLVMCEKTKIKTKEIGEKELQVYINSTHFNNRLNEYTNLGDRAMFSQIGITNSSKQSLAELVWFSVLVASKGRPLTGYNLNDKVSLHEIPDVLLKDYYAHEYKKLAELLFDNPTPVLDAGKKSGHSLYDTINFCNACAVLRIAEFSA